MNMWNSNLYYEKLLDGWERSQTSNGLPYYINHNTERTQWDHPVLAKIFEEMLDMNCIRYAAYRTAMKLRFLQKRLGFDQVPIHALQTVLQRRGLDGAVDTVVDCVDLYGILNDVFQVARSTVHNLNSERQAELSLNLLLNLYDVNRTGCIRLVSIKVGIAAICSARLSEKHRFFFSQFADHTNHLTRKKLGCLLHDLIQIPEVMNESPPFGGLNVSPAVESCFSMVWGSIGASEDVFLSWLLREPQTLVWLPTMHRLAAAESVKHESKCNVCKAFPIVGFRYKCLKCFNFDMCQQCFFTGRLSKNHKLEHPTQEYCITTTSKEDTKAFMKTLRNNLSKKHRNKRKLRYLPIYGHEDGRNPEELGQEDVPPPDMHSMMTRKANKLSAKAQLARQDSDVKYPEPTKDELEHDDQVKGRVGALTLGENQRRELVTVIEHLENENRELMYEIERLHQRRSDSGSDRGSDRGSDHYRRLADDEAGKGHWARGRESPYREPDRPEAHQEVLEAHNRQLELQLQKLRYILTEKDALPSLGSREPLRSVSPNVPPTGRRSKPLVTAVMTPPRVLQQPPPYASATPRSGSASPYAARPIVSPYVQAPSPAPADHFRHSFDDHVDSHLAELSYSATYGKSMVEASYMTIDNDLSRTRFSLPSGGQSQYFPDEEAELAELIERLDQVHPADFSHSILDRDSPDCEIVRAVNQMGQALHITP